MIQFSRELTGSERLRGDQRLKKASGGGESDARVGDKEKRVAGRGRGLQAPATG